MKTRKLAMAAAVSAVLSVSIAGGVHAETATEISKPGGAMGMGKVSPNQAKSNQFWWPDQLDLTPLRDHDSRSNPLGKDFDYAEAIKERRRCDVRSSRRVRCCHSARPGGIHHQPVDALQRWNDASGI
jgi:hypothetical protein